MRRVPFSALWNESFNFQKILHRMFPCTKCHCCVSSVAFLGRALHTETYLHKGEGNRGSCLKTPVVGTKPLLATSFLA